VSVVIVAGGKTTWETLIPKSSLAGPCVHPYGLSADMLAQLDAGGSVVLPSVSIRSGIWPGFTRQEVIGAATGYASAKNIYAEPQVADDVYYLCNSQLKQLIPARVSLLDLAPPTMVVDLGAKFTLSGPQASVDVPRNGPARLTLGLTIAPTNRKILSTLLQTRCRRPSLRVGRGSCRMGVGCLSRRSRLHLYYQRRYWWRRSTQWIGPAILS